MKNACSRSLQNPKYIDFYEATHLSGLKLKIQTVNGSNHRPPMETENIKNNNSVPTKDIVVDVEDDSIIFAESLYTVDEVVSQDLLEMRSKFTHLNGNDSSNLLHKSSTVVIHFPHFSLTASIDAEEIFVPSMGKKPTAHKFDISELFIFGAMSRQNLTSRLSAFMSTGFENSRPLSDNTSETASANPHSLKSAFTDMKWLHKPDFVLRGDDLFEIVDRITSAEYALITVCTSEGFLVLLPGSRFPCASLHAYYLPCQFCELSLCTGSILDKGAQLPKWLPNDQEQPMVLTSESVASFYGSKANANDTKKRKA